MTVASSPDWFLEVVAELGSGGSIGIDLAALISVCNRYYAFDVVRVTVSTGSLEIFGQFLELFWQKASASAAVGFRNRAPSQHPGASPNDSLFMCRCMGH